MTVYAELLRLALASQRGEDARPVGELVAVVIARRALLAEPAARPPTRGPDTSPRKPPGAVGAFAGHEVVMAIDRAISYDAALATLCERVGVEHDLAGAAAGPAARRRAEEALGQRLPALAQAFAQVPAPTSRPARSPRGSS